MKNDLITYTTPETYYSIGICELMLKSPHILIGGTTGAGKSVLIENIIYTLISKYTPFDVRFFLIDTKRVTFERYKHLPHVEQIQTEIPAIIKLLRAMVETMEKRYEYMRQNGLVKYNGRHLFIIIDEMADLMSIRTKKNKKVSDIVTPLIQRLAQLGRACNIHLICATQCPNRQIIPAVITVNFSGRCALRCNNQIESRQILNQKGAELLPQYGKCIYLHCDGNYYMGDIPYIDDEIQAKIDFWLKQGNNDAYFKQTLPGDIPTIPRPSYTFLDFLRGNTLVKRKNIDETELQNILSMIDDD